MNLYAITINDLASRRVAEISHRLARLGMPSAHAGKSLADLSAQRLGAIETQIQALSGAPSDTPMPDAIAAFDVAFPALPEAIG